MDPIQGSQEEGSDETMSTDYRQYVRECLQAYEQNYDTHKECGGEIIWDDSGKPRCEKCGSVPSSDRIILPTLLGECAGPIVSSLVEKVDKLRATVAAKEEEIRRLGRLRDAEARISPGNPLRSDGRGSLKKGGRL